MKNFFTLLFLVSILNVADGQNVSNVFLYEKPTNEATMSRINSKSAIQLQGNYQTIQSVGSAISKPGLKVDSIVNPTSYIRKYTYDTNGNMLSDTWIDAVKNTDSTQYSYNNNNKTEYAYDTAGNRIQQTEYLWDNKSGWLPINKYVSLYGDFGDTLKTDFRYLDNDWVIKQLHKTQYDSTGKKLIELTYIKESIWTGSNYIDTLLYDIKAEYIYNNNLLAVINTYSGSYDYVLSNPDLSTYTVKEKWIKFQTQTCTYNVDNNITETKQYSWNLTDSIMKISSFHNYKYNSNKYLVSETYFSVNSADTTKYNYGWGIELENDEFGNPVTQKMTDWNSDLSVQVSNGQLAKYNYDLNYKWNDVVAAKDIQSFVGFNTNNIITDAQLYQLDSVNNVKTVIANVKIFYSPLNPSGLSSIESSTLKIYPNPSKELIYIEGIKEKTQVSIYDISGKQVLLQSIDANKAVSIKELTSGMYIVKAKTNKGNFECKLMKD